MNVSDFRLNIRGVPVLDSLNVELPDGGVSVLIGPNGAGKTSLLRCLSGEIVPDAGELRLGGQVVDPRSTEWRAKIGVVPDDDAVFPELTVSEQLGLAATVYGLSGAEGTARSRTLLDLFDLWGKRDALGRELSAGMRKRLALTLALIHGPRLLLLDEPLNALDYASGETFFRLIAYLKSAGRTVVVSGHHLTALLRVADQIIQIEHGRTSACLPISESDRDGAAVRARLRTAWNEPSSGEGIDLPWIRS